MRLIGLVVALAVILSAPLAADAQPDKPLRL
jgi:hypothetical protein